MSKEEPVWRSVITACTLTFKTYTVLKLPFWLRTLPFVWSYKHICKPIHTKMFEVSPGGEMRPTIVSKCPSASIALTGTVSFASRWNETDDCDDDELIKIVKVNVSLSLYLPVIWWVSINSYSASHNNWCTGALLNRTITTQWEGMGDVGSVRYEPALLPPCPTIRVLSYSNCQRSKVNSQKI